MGRTLGRCSGSPRRLSTKGVDPPSGGGILRVSPIPVIQISAFYDSQPAATAAATAAFESISSLKPFRFQLFRFPLLSLGNFL